MDLGSLKKMAKEALNKSKDYYHDIKVLDIEELDDFMMEANPSTVLKLIESIETARETLKWYADGTCLDDDIESIEVHKGTMKQHWIEHPGKSAREALSKIDGLLGGGKE